MQDIKRVVKNDHQTNNITSNISTEANFAEEINPTGKKSFFRLAAYFSIFIFLGLLTFSTGLLSSNQTNESWFSRLPIISQVKHLAESADQGLKGEDRDRINILLLGMGGENHDGGYLTDTIILASLEPSTKKVSMLSIPRDLTIPMEGMGWRKINNVNAFAEAKQKGSGGLAISQALGDLLDVPIDYYVRVDFQGFINIVDEMGGVDVYADNVLEDYAYPIMGREDAEPYSSRYEHLYVEKGWHQMNGTDALKFARSRHGLGVEGSDFARAHRQQKIIMALKEKLMNKNILLKPKTITNIIGQLNEHFSTNLNVWEIIKLWSLFKDTTKDSVASKVLDNSPNGLLQDARSSEGAYILEPRSGDFTEIQYMVHNIFSEAPKEYKTKVQVEKATIEIMNGTWVNGLASETALDLERYGYEVIRIANCSKKDFQKTVIYDLTFGEKTESLSVLKDKINANVAYEMPEWLISDITKNLANQTGSEKPDFLVILGQNADASQSGALNSEK